MSSLTEPYFEVFADNANLDRRLIGTLAERSALYVILIMPRSGSTWFCEMIGKTGHLGMPQEWFNVDFIRGNAIHLGGKPPKLRGTGDINGYLEQIVEEGKGAAGVQLSYWQARSLVELSGGRLPVENITWFYLRRRDILSQAISLYKSAVTGYWHSYQGSPSRLDELSFDSQECTERLAKLIDTEVKFEEMFASCGISPHRLLYEDIQTDPLGSLQSFALAIGRDVPKSLPQTELKRLRNNQTDSWKRELEASSHIAEILSVRPDIAIGSARPAS